ncbi:C-GCAxxG-C-C family (seleno)protein [Methanofollis ethanolicus]
MQAFSGGLNCAQAVAGAFADEFGLDEAVVRKLVCGFGGGSPTRTGPARR